MLNGFSVKVRKSLWLKQLCMSMQSLYLLFYPYIDTNFKNSIFTKNKPHLSGFAYTHHTSDVKQINRSYVSTAFWGTTKNCRMLFSKKKLSMMVLESCLNKS